MEKYIKVLEYLLGHPEIYSIEQSSKEVDVRILQELYQRGLIEAIDTSDPQGISFMNPKINMAGREWLSEKSLQLSKSSDTRLERLKSLKKSRGDINAFKKHDEFLLWSDSIAPLLEFDDKLHNSFIKNSNLVKVQYNMGIDHRNSLGETIGLVNQAIIKLELEPENEDQNLDENNSDIQFPDKITIKWLYQHAPLGWWGSLLGLLITAF